MSIRNGQNLLRPGGQPLVTCPAVTLRAMPVAARSVFNRLMGAVVALLYVGAEGGGTARAEYPGKPSVAGETARLPSDRGIPDRAGGRHRRLPAGFPLPPPAVCGVLDRLQWERIEGTGRGMEALHGYTEILGGSSNIRVAEQNLDGAKVRAGVQHVCGAGVAEKVRVQ